MLSKRKTYSSLLLLITFDRFILQIRVSFKKIYSWVLSVFLENQYLIDNVNSPHKAKHFSFQAHFKKIYI